MGAVLHCRPSPPTSHVPLLLASMLHVVIMGMLCLVIMCMLYSLIIAAMLYLVTIRAPAAGVHVVSCNRPTCLQVEPIVDERKKLNVQIQAHLPQVRQPGRPRSTGRQWVPCQAAQAVGGLVVCCRQHKQAVGVLSDSAGSGWCIIV